MLNSSIKKKMKTSSPSNTKESGGAFNLNILAEGSKINGTFISHSDTRICGTIEGDLKADGIIYVTEDGFVEGNIEGNTVNIAGSVKGDINGTHKVFLAETAKVDGSISSDRLVMEEGAVFHGTCKVGPKPKRHSPNPVSSVSNGKNENLAKELA